MSTKALLDVMQQHFKAAGLVKPSSVLIHAGKFTWAELKARCFSAPALFISCLGWKEAHPDEAAMLCGHDLIVEARFAIGVVTKNAKSSEARNAEAQALAGGVCGELIDQDFGLDNALVANRLRAEGLFVPAAERENASLWLVSWHQVVGIDRHELAPGTHPDGKSSINDWLRYGAEHLNAADSNQVLAEALTELDAADPGHTEGTA